MGTTAMSAAPTAAAGTTTPLEQQLHDLVNAERTGAGLAPLRLSEPVADGAREWAGQLAAADTLRHDPTFAEEIWAATGGGGGVAENVGVAPSGSVAEIHDMFMASPDHRASIMAPGHATIGLGIVVDASGTIWVTQRFAGSRR